MAYSIEETLHIYGSPQGWPWGTIPEPEVSASEVPASVIPMAASPSCLSLEEVRDLSPHLSRASSALFIG